MVLVEGEDEQFKPLFVTSLLNIEIIINIKIKTL